MRDEKTIDKKLELSLFDFLTLTLKNDKIHFLVFRFAKIPTDFIKEYLPANKPIPLNLFNLVQLTRQSRQSIVINSRNKGGIIGAFFERGELHIEFGDKKILNGICNYSNIKPHQARIQGSELIFAPDYLSFHIHSMVLLKNKFELNSVKELVEEFSTYFSQLNSWLNKTYQQQPDCLEAKALRLFFKFTGKFRGRETQVYTSNEVEDIVGSNSPTSCLDQFCSLVCNPLFLSAIKKFDSESKRINEDLSRPIQEFLIKLKELSNNSPNFCLFSEDCHDHIKNTILNLAKTYPKSEECAGRLEQILGQFNYIINFHPILREDLIELFEQLHNLIQNKNPQNSTQSSFFDTTNDYSHPKSSHHRKFKSFSIEQIVQKVINTIEYHQKRTYGCSHEQLSVSSERSLKRSLDDSYGDNREYAALRKFN